MTVSCKGTPASSPWTGTGTSWAATPSSPSTTPLPPSTQLGHFRPSSLATARTRIKIVLWRQIQVSVQEPRLSGLALVTTVSTVLWPFRDLVSCLFLGMILSSGFCNASSVLKAPLDYPVCGYRGVRCPEKASEVAPPTIDLLTLITIVVGVLLIGSTSIGYIIRTRNRRLAKKGILGTDEKETKTQKRSTLGNR